MIPQTCVTLQQPLSWQQLLADSFANIDELLQFLALSRQQINLAHFAKDNFPLRVPKGFAARMKKGDAHDPLLKQVLPVADELLAAPGYSHDPLQESEVNPLPGLLHKYHGRVLLTLSTTCPIHCRYCFRRHFPYDENQIRPSDWQPLFDYINADKTITEVILSGGEPLVLSDERLSQCLQKLEKIKHVKRVRFHTRMPIVLAERITDDFIHVFKQTSLKPIFVLHSNHANEIDGSVAIACKKMQAAGFALFNQSVLLKGVNDNAEALIALSEKLFSASVMPYYVHLLDRVAGSAHFNVDEGVAKSLMQEITSRLPGYLVPKLVREVPGCGAKQVII